VQVRREGDCGSDEGEACADEGRGLRGSSVELRRCSFATGN
jgi:hypothetical protein